MTLNARATERREIILGQVDRDGLGLEIGPSFAPIAPKKEGYRVHVLDHCDRAALLEKYRAHQVNLDAIEDVDFIWDGRPYAELVGATHSYSWIIASHVLEHTPDLVGFLNDCASLLRAEGVLSLVVPDQRYCFDHFRSLTNLGRVIDASFQRHRFHSPGTVVEYFLNVVHRSGRTGWSHGDRGTFTHPHTMDEARRALEEVRDHAVYLDVHEWCFTPTSFRLMMRDLFDLGLICLTETAFHDTIGHEFFVTLSRGGRPPPEPRLQLLERIFREQKEAE